MPVYPGRLDQFLDIQGSSNIDNTRPLADENTQTGSQTSTGTGDSFSFITPTITLTDAGATFTSADIGRFITIAGATTGGNNGTFLVTGVPSPTTLTYDNISGAAEAYSGTWTINEPYTAEDDHNHHRTDRKLIKGTTQHYDAVPVYQRPSAVGSNVPKNLTNLLSRDAFARVRDVEAKNIKLRPSISQAGTGNVTGSSEGLTTTDYHFISGDLDSFITLTDGTATGATGTYRVKTVTDGKTLVLDGLNPTGGGTVDWVLLGGIKGVLSTRSYADATDRRGIPIADSGAEDETYYEATFTDLIDPVTNGRPVEEDSDPIFGRSFGDAKDPNRTATNEGSRFFVQLLTGANDGSASVSQLEVISGRNGSAASLTNGTTTVTGLTGMTTADIGRYLTIYGTAVDGNQRHAKITAYNSATSVDVAGSNFTTDGNDGSILWQVSRHDSSWSFFHGDRYRLDELSETAHRTTLISGVVSDAELTQDIAEIREYIGASDGQTTPTLSNTGNYFPFSDLANPADTDLTEIVNVLNQEIGNRDYSATAISAVSGLADGQTITASIEALALAVGTSSVTRTIERLAADILKNTVHTLPGGITYTQDGTSNGRYLWVYWRGMLRDPGLIVNGDDYAETSTTQITPYSKIRAGDHINYFVLQ